MNNTVTINVDALSEQGGVNKMELLQSKRPDIVERYEAVFAKVEESFTTVTDNDSQHKIRVAVAVLCPNELQTAILYSIAEALKEVEQKIDPNRLQFTITKAMDDEICLNRTSANGLAKIIINEDGLVVLTFTAVKESAKANQFIPYTEGIGDYEALAYDFFAL